MNTISLALLSKSKSHPHHLLSVIPGFGLNLLVFETVSRE